jgi:hypothetical protein
MNPARALTDAMTAILDELGERASQRAVSELLLGGSSQLATYIARGDENPLSTSTIAAWLATWEAAGYPPLEVVVGAERCEVRRAAESRVVHAT